jgi:hypothetical protein
VAVAASRLDVVDMMVRECGVDVNSVDKKMLSGHVTRWTSLAETLFWVSWTTSKNIDDELVPQLFK